MVELLEQGLHRLAEGGEVPDPAQLLVDRAVDVHPDPERVPVQPRALVAGLDVRQPMGCLEGELLEYVHVIPGARPVARPVRIIGRPARCTQFCRATALMKMIGKTVTTMTKFTARGVGPAQIVKGEPGQPDGRVAGSQTRATDQGLHGCEARRAAPG